MTTPANAPDAAGLEHRLRDRLRLQRLRASGGWRSRLWLALALVGPGVLVMLGDNDAGGVLTYAQTGAAFGLGLYLPLLALLGFIAYLVQEMTIRLGAVTRRGHAELIWKRYGPFWGWFSLLDLIAANVLALITEFAGIRVGAAVLGVPPWASVTAAFAFIAITLLTLRYSTWERVTLIVALPNLLFIPLLVWARPDWGAVAASFVGHGWAVPGGLFSATFLLLLSANIGTTIAPWQLFFQQSCVVDKGLLPKDIAGSRRELMLGVFGMTLVALAIIALAAQTLHGLPGASSLAFKDVFAGIEARLGPFGMSLFALGLIDCGLIAAVVITASSAWSIGEAFGFPASLNAPPRQALGFYLPALACTAIAAAVVLLPQVPLGLLNLVSQVLATVFMPSALLFLLLLLNDRELMGDHVNGPWRNLLSWTVMAALVACNALYALSILLPDAFHP